MLKKSNTIPKIISILLIISLSFTVFPTSIAANTVIDSSDDYDVNYDKTFETQSSGSLPTTGMIWDSWETILANQEEVPAFESFSVLPSSVDLTSKFPIPHATGQGPQNNCVAWAVAYALKSGQENIARNTNTHLFSPSYVYNQLNGGQNTGITISGAMSLIVDQGVCSLESFPYVANNLTTQPTQQQRTEAAKYKAPSFHTIIGVDNIKRRLADRDGVVIGINILEEFDILNIMPSSNYSVYFSLYPNQLSPPKSNGVYVFENPNSPPSMSNGVKRTHALTLVGYDDNLQAFKYINSWGNSRGYNGYGWIAYDMLSDLRVNNLGIAFGYVLERPLGPLPLRGSGTDNDPYLIQSVFELDKVREHLNASFKLTSDINVFFPTWEPIGTKANPFKGKFDGDGFKIHNLNINEPDMQYVGLFGYTDSAVIKNVTIEGANVTGKIDTGGLIGHSKKSTVENCSIVGSGLVKGESNVGGLIGSKEYGDVSGSNSKIDVIGTISGIGGLIGDNSGIVTKSFSTGNVSGPLNVGGLIGYVRGDELISQTSSAASVVGTGAGNRMGGLIGRIGSASVRVEDSFAMGTISGAGECGGLVGYSSNANIKNCYFAGSVTGSKRGGITPSTSLIVTNSYFDSQTTGLSAPTAQAKTTQQLKDSSTFAGWDFAGTWYIANNSYPTLRELDDSAMVGNGSKNNPYQITKVEHLKQMEDYCGYYFKLMNDIDLNNQPWTPIEHFCGTLDGNGYTISNLKIDLPNTDYVGLFGVTENAKFYNLTIENVDVKGQDRVGALVGYSEDIEIENCWVIGTGQVIGRGYVGGLIGQAHDDSLIKDSGSFISVTGMKDYVGGLIGRGWTTLIDNCQVETKEGVSGADCVGGLVGYVYEAKILNSSTSTDVVGGRDIGGLVGWFNEDHHYFIITNCSINGDISGREAIGGIVGGGSLGDDIAFTKVTVSGSVTGVSEVGGIIGRIYGDGGTVYFTNLTINASYSGSSNVGQFWGYKSPKIRVIIM